jgi:predicted metal-dependent hydrolase
MVKKLYHLRRGMPKTILRQTLLHEMCHIGDPYHGHRFLSKLRKLAQAGEKWAKKKGIFTSELSILE